MEVKLHAGFELLSEDEGCFRNANNQVVLASLHLRDFKSSYSVSMLLGLAICHIELGVVRGLMLVEVSSMVKHVSLLDFNNS